MGRGDIKSKKGKLAAGSYGVRRPKRKKNGASSVVAPQATETPKKNAPKAKPAKVKKEE